MVSLQSGNPRENVAFGTARGQERPTSDNEGTQRSLAALEQQSTTFSNLTLHQLLIRAASCNVVELSRRALSKTQTAEREMMR